MVSQDAGAGGFCYPGPEPAALQFLLMLVQEERICQRFSYESPIMSQQPPLRQNVGILENRQHKIRVIDG